MNAQAPAWLFSFVDLAFLLLIAMTQVSVESNGLNLDLGEIAVPKIDSEATENLKAGAAERWQVRIHAAALSEGLPYELVRVDPGKAAPGERMDARALRERLEAMHAAGTLKPLLAPHEDSRSHDLLDAVGMLEERWSHRRRATVARLLASQ